MIGRARGLDRQRGRGPVVVGQRNLELVALAVPARRLRIQVGCIRTFLALDDELPIGRARWIHPPHALPLLEDDLLDGAAAGDGRQLNVHVLDAVRARPGRAGRSRDCLDQAIATVTAGAGLPKTSPGRYGRLPQCASALVAVALSNSTRSNSSRGIARGGSVFSTSLPFWMATASARSFSSWIVVTETIVGADALGWLAWALLSAFASCA